VDAGSAGVDTFVLFDELVLKRCAVNCYAMLNVSAAGLATERWPENLDPALFSLTRIKECLEVWPGKIVALKIRMSREIVGASGYKPLDAALELAEDVGLPLVVHTPDPPGDAEDLVERLRAGDIYAHTYNPYGSNIFDSAGMVKKAFMRARQRGVVFDTSCAKRFYTFPILKAALEQGFAPSIISSDITAFNHCDPLSHGMAYAMTRFMAFGMPLPDVVRAATSTPAMVMKLKEHGDLSCGSVADVAVFREEEHPMLVKDYMGNTTTIEKWLVPQMTILKGKVVYRQLLFRNE
ncbi:MAG: amidohydrolase family protein, partial [Desulfovibrio sp.]|uniref:amidohydrolase family protein n=1 Tax=Desulfovibrio sp. TaxID=885 RepID=UPI0039E70C52